MSTTQNDDRDDFKFNLLGTEVRIFAVKLDDDYWLAHWHLDGRWIDGVYGSCRSKAIINAFADILKILDIID